MAASHSCAYMAGLLVLPISTHPLACGSRRPIGGRIHGATSERGAMNTTRAGNSHPSPRFFSRAATGTGELAGSALAKVIRALPENVGRQAAALHNYASAAPDRHAAHPDPAVTSALVVAVASRHRVRLGYRSQSGGEWEAEVDPWAVVVRHGRWYLLCHSHHAGAVRSYRIDRVSTVEHTRHPFTPPDGLDPVAALEENLGEGWDFPVRVVFMAPHSEVAPWIRAPMGRLEAHASGCVLIGSTGNPTMYAQEWLAAIPFAFRVEGGDELRAAVAALASRCAAAVKDQPGQLT